MQYTVSSLADTLEIKLSGTLTFDDHTPFKNMLSEVQQSQKRSVVMNLKALTAIDSAGVGLLLLANDKAKGQGKNLKVAEMSGAVAKVAELFKLNQLLQVI